MCHLVIISGKIIIKRLSNAKRKRLLYSSRGTFSQSLFDVLCRISSLLLSGMLSRAIPPSVMSVIWNRHHNPVLTLNT